MYVARLRYIQTVHEARERRNPDTWVRRFIPLSVRIRTSWMSKAELSQLRSDPFYYYLLARTRYYDAVLEGALAEGIGRLVMVGCGSDTRSFRYQAELAKRGISVLECDQDQAIREKQRLTRGWPQTASVSYMAIDLNNDSWPNFEKWLANGNTKTLVMIEGVSPYINEKNYVDFLRLLSGRLPAGSSVAYDYKLAGMKDSFGKNDRTARPFRLSASQEQARAFHEPLGLKLEHFELGPELSTRLVPGLAGPLFEEDGLLRMRVATAQ